MVTVLIPNYNGAHWLQICLPSLENSTYRDFEIIIVDNHSTDDSFAVFEKYNGKKKWIPLDKNYGFAKAVNIGIKEVTSEFLFLLNNDTHVTPDAIQKLLDKIIELSKKYAAVQPLMVRMDNPSIIDDSGDSLSWYGEALKGNHGEKIKSDLIEKEIFSPSGGATLFRTNFLVEMNGFDEKYGSYLEDIDLGLRGQLYGYKYWLLPDAIIYHKGHGSRIASQKYVRLLTRNRLLLFTKNIPRELLIKHFFKIMFGQLYFFIAYARPLYSILGYFDFLKKINNIKEDRVVLRPLQSLDNSRIEKLISFEKPKASIFQITIDAIYNFVRNRFFSK